jgi:hypothetical protein
MRPVPRALPVIHGAAGTVALVTIASFWIATIVSELVGETAQIAGVKQGIVRGLVVLVPAMIAAAATGRVLAGPAPRGLSGKKYRRMRVVAALGALVLVPAALVLARWAAAGRLDSAFYAVQAIELMAGAINLTLLGWSFRDGLRLRAVRMRSVSATHVRSSAR